jgi:hypothetical protein
VARKVSIVRLCNHQSPPAPGVSGHADDANAKQGEGAGLGDGAGGRLEGKKSRLIEPREVSTGCPLEFDSLTLLPLRWATKRSPLESKAMPYGLFTEAKGVSVPLELIWSTTPVLGRLPKSAT